MKKTFVVKLGLIISFVLTIALGFQNCSPVEFSAPEGSEKLASLSNGQCEDPQGKRFENGETFQTTASCSNNSTITENYKCDNGVLLSTGNKEVCTGDISSCSKNGLFYNDGGTFQEILQCDGGVEKINKFKCVSGNFSILEQSSCTQTATSGCESSGTKYTEGLVSINRGCSNGLIVVDKYNCAAGVLTAIETPACQTIANTSCPAGQVKINGVCGNCSASQTYDSQAQVCRSTTIACNNGSVVSPDGKTCIAATYSFVVNSLSYDPGFSGYQILNAFEATANPGKINPISLAVTNTGNSFCTIKAEQILNFLNGSEYFLSNLSLTTGAMLSSLPVAGQASVNFSETLINKRPDLGAMLVNTNQAIHSIKLKCAEDPTNNSVKWIQILPKINLISNAVTCGLNACAALNSTAKNTFLSATDSGIRVLSGENLNIFPAANNQKIAINKGSQSSISAGFTGMGLYFERPISEYNFSSSGNNLIVTDSCGRRTTLIAQSNQVILYFPEGYFKVVLTPILPIYEWRISTGSQGSTLLTLDSTKNISELNSTIKPNLTPLANSQKYFTCPLAAP